MYRQQTHVQVRLGHWREFYDLYEKLEEVERAKKLASDQLWTPTVGPINAALLVTEYDTLDAMEKDSRAFQADADCMKIWREMGEFTEGIPWIDLWESAYQIA